MEPMWHVEFEEEELIGTFPVKCKIRVQIYRVAGERQRIYAIDFIRKSGDASLFLRRVKHYRSSLLVLHNYRFPKKMVESL